MDNNQEIKDGVSLKDILNDKNGVLLVILIGLYILVPY